MTTPAEQQQDGPQVYLVREDRGVRVGPLEPTRDSGGLVQFRQTHQQVVRERDDNGEWGPWTPIKEAA